ncbi:PAS domain-containing protein [Dongia sp.]|uniref:PAS domain-containing protein n=1 Tax=Dongia sp. TaxID=1977262 RepID=UPI0035B43915
MTGLPHMTRSAPDWLDAMPADIQALYHYWDRQRGERLMPARGDLDPLDMKPFLPGLLLVDVVADDRLYVYRLVGTREVELRGKDPTGLAVVDNAFCADPSHALRNYDQVVLSRAPWIDTTPHLSADRHKLSLESIFLPLSSNGTEVDKILVYAAHKSVDLPLV